MITEKDMDAIWATYEMTIYCESDFDAWIGENIPYWAQNVIVGMAVDNANDTISEGARPSNHLWQVAKDTAEMIWDDPGSYGLKLQ